MTENASHTYRFGEKVVLNNVDFLRSELESVFASEHVRRIIFDLENLRICDTYGVQLFLDFQRSAEKLHKELLFYRPGTPFMEIIKNAGLLQTFSIITELDEND